MVALIFTDLGGIVMLGKYCDVGGTEYPRVSPASSPALLVPAAVPIPLCTEVMDTPVFAIDIVIDEISQSPAVRVILAISP